MINLFGVFISISLYNFESVNQATFIRNRMQIAWLGIGTASRNGSRRKICHPELDSGSRRSATLLDSGASPE